MSDEGTQTVRHIVGNMIANVRMFHQGQSSRNVSEIRALQSEATSRLERKLSERETNEQGALDVLAALKRYDWGDEQAYRQFERVYENYVGDYEREGRELRDKLFRYPK